MSYVKHLTNKFGDSSIQKPSVPADVTTLTDLRDNIEAEHTARKGRLRVEEQYIRATFLLDRELNERLNRIKDIKSQERGGKGWKTMAFNKAIAALLREYE